MQLKLWDGLPIFHQFCMKTDYVLLSSHGNLTSPHPLIKALMILLKYLMQMIEDRRRGYTVFSVRQIERRNEYEASVSSFIVKWSHLMVETCHCIYIYKKDPRYRLRHSTANTYIIIIIK